MIPWTPGLGLSDLGYVCGSDLDWRLGKGSLHGT